MFEDIFGCHNFMVVAEDTTGIWWVEAGDAAKHLRMYRTVLHNKELSSQNANGTEAEKPWIKQFNFC